MDDIPEPDYSDHDDDDEYKMPGASSAYQQPNMPSRSEVGYNMLSYDMAQNTNSNDLQIDNGGYDEDAPQYTASSSRRPDLPQRGHPSNTSGSRDRLHSGKCLGLVVLLIYVRADVSQIRWRQSLLLSGFLQYKTSLLM